MPTKDRLQILLPRAIDRGYGVIASREFDMRIYCKTQSYYRVTRLEKILYSPSWAKVECRIYISGQETLSISGDGGEIPIEFDATESSPIDFSLFNNSIDTEVRFNLYLVGWQMGEG